VCVCIFKEEFWSGGGGEVMPPNAYPVCLRGYLARAKHCPMGIIVLCLFENNKIKRENVGTHFFAHSNSQHVELVIN
jgi:hypothetical protein